MMESPDIIRMQDIIRQNPDDVKRALNDLDNWQKEIKKEEKKIQADGSDKVAPTKIRSNIFEEPGVIDSGKSYDSDRMARDTENSATRKEDLEESSKWKEAGNEKVKLQEYEKAIDAYTRAIECYDSDPNFYANRALCYLRLEKYEKCVEDCKQAIRLDPSKIKAFYRMMQAYEAMYEVEIAVEYCRKALAVDPLNKEAQKSLQRLEGKICENKRNCADVTKSEFKAVWSPIETKNIKRIRPVIKSVHLRSQAQLKRIKILETYDMAKQYDKGKCIKNLANHAATAKNKVKESNATEDVIPKNLEQSTQIRKLVVPSSSSHFYSTWKEIVSDEEKFAYLNVIGTKNLNRVLGACFDYDTLSAFIVLLDKYCAEHRRIALDILLELSQHDQIRILSMFLSTSDLQALERLLFELESDELNKKDLVVRNFGLKNKI